MKTLHFEYKDARKRKKSSRRISKCFTAPRKFLFYFTLNENLSSCEIVPYELVLLILVEVKLHIADVGRPVTQKTGKISPRIQKQNSTRTLERSIWKLEEKEDLAI